MEETFRVLIPVDLKAPSFKEAVTKAARLVVYLDNEVVATVKEVQILDGEEEDAPGKPGIDGRSGK